jgi:MFS family permease
MLIALRMLQGLAIGGEYGGAVIYVAEHVPPLLRGLPVIIAAVTVVAGVRWLPETAGPRSVCPP